MKELLKNLTSITGPSSRENEVSDFIEKYLKGKKNGLTFQKDALGNLIVRKKGAGKKIMLAAHMDEIGFMVKHIDKNGFLRFSVIGGIFPVNIIDNRVKFLSGIEGVIGYEEKNFDWKTIPQLKNMYIDIGAKSAEDARKMVKIGDVAVFGHMFSDMGDRVSVKALDDRIGCLILMKVAEQKLKTENDLYFVFTSQEEVGVRGATVSSFSIDPDFAIAVDVTGTGDTPESHIMEVSVGKGAAIKVKDGGMLVRKSVYDFMAETAEKNKIKYQMEILQGGTTDAYAIQTAKSGVLAGAISVPTRYIHSQSELCDMNDVEACIRLITKIVEQDISKRGF